MNSLLICSHELPLELEKLESLVWCDEDTFTAKLLSQADVDWVYH